MVKFDPNNELSEEELNKLGEENFDDFLDYLVFNFPLLADD